MSATTNDKRQVLPWTVTTETDFQALMEQIDQELRANKIPIPARPIKGWLTVSGRYGHGLSMFPPKKVPTPGSFKGDDLSLRIFEWFDIRYGDQLKIDHSPGHSIVVVRGDAYRVELPLIYNRVRMVCDPAHHGQDYYPKLTKGKDIATVNVLDCIVDLQPALSNALKPHELREIFHQFARDLRSFQMIETLYKLGLGIEARGDLMSSVDSVLRLPPQYGASRWHSLQSAEKYLKTFLKERGAAYPTGGPNAHNLLFLTKSAVGAGMAPLSDKPLVSASCGSKVRYGEVHSTLEEAVTAHRAAVIICAHVTSCLQRLKGKTAKAKMP
jgi:hypothetical protein